MNYMVYKTGGEIINNSSGPNMKYSLLETSNP